MSSVAAWEEEFKKPVVTTNPASVWAMLRALNGADRLPAFGRLLAEVPADASETTRRRSGLRSALGRPTAGPVIAVSPL